MCTCPTRTLYQHLQDFEGNAWLAGETTLDAVTVCDIDFSDLCSNSRSTIVTVSPPLSLRD